MNPWCIDKDDLLLIRGVNSHDFCCALFAPCHSWWQSFAPWRDLKGWLPNIGTSQNGYKARFKCHNFLLLFKIINPKCVGERSVRLLSLQRKERPLVPRLLPCPWHFSQHRKVIVTGQIHYIFNSRIDNFKGYYKKMLNRRKSHSIRDTWKQNLQRMTTRAVTACFAYCVLPWWQWKFL